jgi:hypothetical protein
VKGIQVYSNKGPGPLQRGDNYKNVKMGSGHLKIFFSRTSGPILTRLGTNYPWVKGIQICSKKGDKPLQGEIIAIGDHIWTDKACLNSFPIFIRPLKTGRIMVL